MTRIALLGSYTCAYWCLLFILEIGCSLQIFSRCLSLLLIHNAPDKNMPGKRSISQSVLQARICFVD